MIYRWPGNVRQLKNVVEQLALFHAGSSVSRSEIMDYLPSSSKSSGDTSMPAKPANSYDAEREFIWQSIFALRAEIAQLKELIGAKTSAESSDENLNSYLKKNNALTLRDTELLKP